MNFHPAADLFPLMDGKEFEEFAEDIRENGLQEPIKLLKGLILDGRNRWRACEEKGVEPKFANLPDDTDPERYVASLNWFRRNLDESQRAMIAAELAKMRMGDNRGAHRPKKGSANVPTLSEAGKDPISQPEAAALLNVGERTLRDAKRVIKKGAPEVIDMVKKGKKKGGISVKKALQIVTQHEDKEDQVEALNELKKGVGKKPSANGKHTPSPSNPSTGEEAKGTSGQREKAHNAACEVIDYLKRSPLMRIGASNPHRAYAFNKVAHWLRQTLKRTKKDVSS